MSKILITGSLGLTGKEAVKFFKDSGKVIAPSKWFTDDIKRITLLDEWQKI